MSEVFLVSLVNVLTFWQKDLFLWFLACAVNVRFGFGWAATGSAGDAIWTEGIVVIALGTFCLCRAVMLIAGRK